MSKYINISKPVCIVNGATVAGPIESKGPLRKYFDTIFDDNLNGQKSWEKSERIIMQTATENVLKKCSMQTSDIDVFLAGDLLNQIITSTFTARSLQIPYIGLYGACSSFAQSMMLAALLLQNQAFKNVLIATSSHNSTSERQFRYPTEYGVQVPPTAQYTVTGSGAAVVSSDNSKSNIYITAVTIGHVVDLGIKNPYEMGAAMAPAAVDVIKTHLKKDQDGLESFDAVLTGDLGVIGKKIVRNVLLQDGINLGSVYNDCGVMIYDIEQQNVNAGGSGCACSALVTLGYILSQLKSKKIKKVLIVSTGALLSPTTYQQKESIPGIAHAICIERKEKRV